MVGNYRPGVHRMVEHRHRELSHCHGQDQGTHQRQLLLLSTE